MEEKSEEKFTLGGCDWSMEFDVYAGSIRILFKAEDSKKYGWWTRDVTLSLVLVNQHGRSNSIIRGTRETFSLGSPVWKEHFRPFTVLLDGTKGFLVEDTLILEVSLTVHSITRIESMSDNLEEAAAEAYETPILEEMEHAKQSLEECLSSPFFHLGMKEKLSQAVSSLISSPNRRSLSRDQRTLLLEFYWNLDHFVRSYETFEQASSAFVMAKVEAEEAIAATKEELSRTMEKVNAKKRKFIPELDACVTQTEKAREICMLHEGRVKRAREAKMRAEDGKEESITAWLKLQKVFTSVSSD